MRCLVLADRLSADGWTCVFACDGETLGVVPALARSPHRSIVLHEGARPADALMELVSDGCDLLVVDDYGLDAGFEKALRGWARAIVVIDDLANRPHDCDLLLDMSLGRHATDYAERVPPACRLLIGPSYALLRPQFAAGRAAALIRRRQAPPVGRLLVSLGGTDPHGLTGRVLEGVVASGLALSVDVVAGLAETTDRDHLRDKAAAIPRPVRLLAGVEDMAGLMSGADLAVGAGGGSALERCCLGLPTLLIVTAENQTLQANAIAQAGGAGLLGWHERVTPAKIATAINRLAGDAHGRSAMAEAAAALCDGEGAKRLVEAIREAVKRSPARPRA